LVGQHFKMLETGNFLYLRFYLHLSNIKKRLDFRQTFLYKS
jgi:hypothetical protein